MSRVLLYGDVDLNLIDGSAIWLVSLAEVFAGMPDVSVSVLQKTRLNRDVVIQSAASLPNVTFLDPWDLADRNPQARPALNGCPVHRLSPESAAALVELLDQEESFDVLFVRSLDTAALLVHSADVASRLWVYVTNPTQYASPPELTKLREVARRCGRIVCQTDEARSALAALLDADTAADVLVLPPMIPSLNAGSRPPPEPSAPRLGYFGKFSPPYMILEMLDAFERIRRELPSAEFHVVGDKFHNAPPVDGFVETVRRRLTATPGVVWHGGVSRTEATDILRHVHFASSWRGPAFDDCVELSTKILEYSALGLPVLMNPTPIQRRIFGSDYPAYVTDGAEFVDRVLSLTAVPMLYNRASQSVQAKAAQFTYESHRRRLMSVLPGGAPRLRVTDRTPTILWAGHDFKFLRQIRESVERAGPYRGLTDEYKGHTIRHPERSRELLRQADVIFCEWCLGNVEWYSKHKQPHQRLVARLHHQELDLPYLDRIRWDNVDRLIFICPRNMDRFLVRFPSMEPKCTLIYNAIDCSAFDLPKLEGAEFNLGMLGIAPKRKAPHIALEILAKLKEHDSRYTLFIKGRHPSEYAWLWRKPTERSYYERLFDAVNNSPYANSVVFDPHGDDVADWFTKIGFILSPSDHEGSHQAVAEGMAAGSIPIIRHWAGADLLYPRTHVFSTTSHAVNFIRECGVRATYDTQTAFCRAWATRFKLPLIAGKHSQLFADLLFRGTYAAAASPQRGSSRQLSVGISPRSLHIAGHLT